MGSNSAEATNAAAMEAAEKRAQGTDNLIQHLDEQLAARDYASPDRKKLEKLKADLARARSEMQDEIRARQDLEDAYERSDYANKDAAPAVIGAAKKLAQVRKANKPVLHGKANFVNDLCQPCLNKEIDSIVDCDTPFFAKYGSGGGPKYKDCHQHTLGGFSGWNDLIRDKIKTPSEKHVLVVMSANEGDLDAVQAYDSEIVTLGAMQKTVNSKGTGELPVQLRQFRDDPATRQVFDRELGNKGYSIGKEIVGHNKDGSPKYGSADALYFTDPQDPKATPITGSDLDDLIQDHPERQKELLGPFRSLGRTPEFQKKQVLDFNDRLTTALGKKPKGYSKPIGDYVTSEKGAALVLDQDVNRPGYVSTDFGKALDQFYKDNPGAPRDPASWSAGDRAAYESEILDDYKDVRRGTDMANRAEKLEQSKLSDTPGSLTFP